MIQIDSGQIELSDRAQQLPGEKIKLTILRDNKKQDIEVTLGKRPDQVEPE